MVKAAGCSTWSLFWRNVTPELVAQARAVGIRVVPWTVNDPVDELWLHHVPSGTVIGGENLGWMFPKDEFDKLPGMFKMMMAPEKVYVMKARKVGDRDKVAAHWGTVLSWPAKVVMTYHDPPGHAFVGDGQAALRAAAHAVGQLQR